MAGVWVFLGPPIPTHGSTNSTKYANYNDSGLSLAKNNSSGISLRAYVWCYILRKTSSVTTKCSVANVLYFLICLFQDDFLMRIAIPGINARN